MAPKRRTGDGHGAGGARRAPPEPHVRAMFDDVVERYDALNTVLSLGRDRRWRRVAAGAVHPGPGDRVLDLGCGTGKVGLELAGRARVVGVDVSRRMLERAQAEAGSTMAFVQGSAFRLPFAEGVFRAAVSGFVLRNLDDLPKAFAELARVVAPGGEVALLDITGPANPVVRRAFDLYFRTAAPLLGALVGKTEPYRYLVRSLAHLPRPDRLCAALEAAGFSECRAKRLSGGMVTLFTAVRR